MKISSGASTSGRRTSSAWQKTAAAPRAHQPHQRGRGAYGVSVAPTCVVTATRSRSFRNSATSWTVLFFVRVVNRSYLPQSVLYPGYLFHDRVGLEAEPGGALQARLSPYGGLDAPGRAVQAFPGAARVSPGEDAVEDRGLREVGAHGRPSR